MQGYTIQWVSGGLYMYSTGGSVGGGVYETGGQWGVIIQYRG